MTDFNFCYTVVLGKQAGSNIGIIKKGVRGYVKTDLNWGVGKEANQLVREANDLRGIDSDTQLDFEIKSMFVWPEICEMA